MDKIVKESIKSIANTINTELKPIEVLFLLENQNLLCVSELIKSMVRKDFFNLLDDTGTRSDLYDFLADKYCLSRWTIKKYCKGI
jgi:hypothetical protein